MTETPEEMAPHLQLLGILALLLGGFSLIGGLAALVALGTAAPFFEASGGPEGVLAVLLFVPVVGLAVGAIVCGVGLLKHRAWARPPSLVVAAFSLFSVPVGTAFGAYAFWVLTRPGTAQLLGARPRRAGS